MVTRLTASGRGRRELARALRSHLKAVKALSRELPSLLARTRRIVKLGDGRYPTV
jgi:hypothetical protein